MSIIWTDDEERARVGPHWVKRVRKGYRFLLLASQTIRKWIITRWRIRTPDPGYRPQEPGLTAQTAFTSTSPEKNLCDL
ncbi:MAG TPA: hypothetical protein VKZ59_00715 [Acidobacteriota bacterium]|nr:hypothetical protein [Acidobacteriota bacterium]